MPDNLTVMQTYSRCESIICSNIIVDLDADSKKATLYHVRNLHVTFSLNPKDICAVRKWISESGIDRWSVHPSQQLFAHNSICGPTSFLPSSVWNLMWKTQLSSSSSHPLLLGTGGVIFSTRLANGSDVFSIIASAWLHVDFVSFTTSLTSLGILI